MRCCMRRPSWPIPPRPGCRNRSAAPAVHAPAQPHWRTRALPPTSVAESSLDLLAHRNKFDGHTACDRIMNHRARPITERLVQAHPRERAHPLEAPATPGAPLAFAALEQRPADATAGVVGIDEEGADLGRIDLRVEL